MANPQVLTQAFIVGHPAEAARVMEELPVADASALFAEIPARIGAPVLSAMLPPAAARVLRALTEAQILALLTAAGTQTAVSMLRHMPDPARSRLIVGLPTVSALASRVLLGFPEDSIGAWIDPEVIALPPGTRVAEALERIRHGQETEIERIMVVDAERRLTGEVTLEALLHASEMVTIATLMRPTIATLAAMMPIAAAAELTSWERTSMLPVVDHDGHLIGVLRQSVVVRALHDRTRQAHTGSAESAAGILGSSYWGVISGLAGATLALLPQVERVLPEDQ